jgi:plasmid stabilization system protein ParE
VILYTIAPEYIFIVRVLHAQADFKRHFETM